ILWSFCVGLLVSKALLLAGVEAMLIRYPLSLLTSYGAFFVGVRLWLAYVGAAPFGNGRGSSLTDRGSGNSGIDLANWGGSGSGSGLRGGGGDFSGGGASASFGEVSDAAPRVSMGSLRPTF